MNRREGKKIAVMAAIIIGFMMIVFTPFASATVTSFTVTPGTGLVGDFVDSYNASVTTDGVTKINITIPAGFIVMTPTTSDVQIARVDFWNNSGYYGYCNITANNENPTTMVDIHCKFGGDEITTTQPINYTAGATTTLKSGFAIDTSEAKIKLPTETLNGPGCVVFARNKKLLENFDTERDLGLDAADVLDVEHFLVAFSTSLDDPNGQFTDGDLLVTNGAVIPNIALLAKFDIQRADLGLDAVHFIGDVDSIIKFMDHASQVSRDEWLKNLPEMLERYDIDIWFSTDTAPTPEAPRFLDGDLLSARTGTIVVANADLLPASVPAGIPDRGVDFGLDAVIASRSGDREGIQFSTEMLYRGKTSFTDGDVLRIGNGVICTNEDLIECFEPKANFLGLDALSIAVNEQPPKLDNGSINITINCTDFQLKNVTIAIRLFVRNPKTAGDYVFTTDDGKTATVKLTGICRMLYFSTEEDFVTLGPEPPDGNPIISDGDLLYFADAKESPGSERR
jgi:hypothetical protein